MLLAGDFLDPDPTVCFPLGFGPLSNGREMLGAQYDHNSLVAGPEAENSLFPPPQTEYSTGQRSQLFIRAEFEDRTFDPEKDYSDEALRARMAEINAFHIANSYGQVSFPDSLFEIVPGTVTVPFTVAEINQIPNFNNALHQAARGAVQDQIDAGTLTLSQPIDDFDTVTVLFPNIHDTNQANWGGLGSKPGQSLWLHDTISARIWGHELGHNMGAGHADFWEPNDPDAVVSPIGEGTQYEYGNHLDLMGSGELGNDFGAYWKGRLGWLTEGVQIVDVVDNGLYTLHALDENTAEVDRHYGLRIERNAEQEYWLEHRVSAGSELADGVIVNLRNLSGDTEPALIDMTPNSIPGDYTDDRQDAALALGQMYSDWDADVHVTALARHEAPGDDSIDVVVQRGPFVGNRPPAASLAPDAEAAATGATVQFTARFSEPDGDPTAIAWDFGDGQTAHGTDSASHAWQASGQYPVRLSVADTKGAAVERVEIINVGAVDQQIASLSQLETTANTQTTDEQTKPAIASDGSTRFVVVWQSAGQDGDGWGIYGQRFLADGTKLGGEFRINTALAGDQAEPDVAMDAAGNFVVVWEGAGNDQQEIFAQRFDWNANPLGDEFQVNTNEYYLQVKPAVAIRPTTGEFVVAWSSGVTGRDIRYRRYSADGTPIDAAEQIAGGGRAFSDVDVAMNSLGEFVLVWDDGAGSSQSEVFAQKFNADGTQAVATFQVNATSDGLQQEPRVAIDDDGAFSVVWEAEIDGLSLKSGWLRNFARDGTPQTADLPLSENPEIGLANPEIAIGAQGQRIVGWRTGRENFTGTHDGDLTLRLFDADGTALTGDFVIDVQYTQWFTGPALAAIGSPQGFVAANPTRNNGDVDVQVHFFATLDAPRLAPDFATTDVTAPVVIDVLANDSAGGYPLSLSIFQAPRHGDAEIDDGGTPGDPTDDRVLYTPRGQFVGVDSFVYSAARGQGDGYLEVASVQVGPWDNLPPTAAEDLLAVSQNQPLVIGTLQLMENDSDGDDGQLRWQSFTQPTHGTLADLGDGSLLYRPEAGYAGPDSFRYTIEDRQGGTAEGTVTLDVQAASTAIEPGELLVYYGWPTSLNGTNSVDGAAAEFGVYDFVVLGAGLELDSHGDHDNTVAIMAHPDTAGTRFFGYIDLGVTTSNFTDAEIRQRIDLWRTMGVDGIFFDDFGYNFGTSRARQNAAVSDAHRWGLPVVANGFFVDQVLGDQQDASYNPQGEATRLTAADFYLYESYQISEGNFLDESVWQDKTDRLETYRDSLGIQVLALTTEAEANTFDSGRFDYAWYSALLYGYEGFGWGEFDFAASSGTAPYHDRPQLSLGEAFSTGIVETSPRYERDTSRGRISVDALTHEVSYLLFGLSLRLADDTIPENGGTTTATVSRPGTAGSLVVTLTTDDPGEATIQSPAIVVDGQSSVTGISVAAHDDPDLDGTQMVTFTATAEGYLPAATILQVSDDDSPSDADGVPDAVEDGAPNGGDGNNDGVLDRKQVFVASLPSNNGLEYVTLVTESTAAFANVAPVANPAPAGAPGDVAFPIDFFDFSIEQLDPDGGASVTLYWQTSLILNTFYKYGPTPGDPTPHWYPFMFDGQTGASIYADRIEIHFRDGLRGDDDLTADGRIVGTTGPGQVPNPWQNPINPFDVDNSGNVAPLDVLTLINDINANSSRSLPQLPENGNRIPAFLDVDGDLEIKPFDVLQVINYINSQPG